MRHFKQTLAHDCPEMASSERSFRKGHVLVILNRILLLCLCCAMSACAQFPELDDEISKEAKAAPYPDLVPVEELRAGLKTARITDQTQTSLEARVAALRVRAARLKRTVIDRNARNRLEQKPAVPDAS